MKSTRDLAEIKEKYGIKLWVHKTKSQQAGVVYIEVEKGHLEEFYHKTSTFVYYVLDGEGTFYLNERATPVKATDVIVLSPMTKIYYMGKMKLLLVTTPAWKEKDEVHVRYIEGQ